MDLLLLFLLTSTVLVQGYKKDNDPNNEPFLPIYPVYPYSPKLIKRGLADRENGQQLAPDLYAPKVGAKDSYGASVNANHPREPYPSHSPYPKVPSSPNYGFYGSLPYPYPPVSYNAYPPTPFTVPPPSYEPIPYSASYPNYYYQSAYYYHPNGYYGKPLFYTPPPPPPPPAPIPNYPGNAPYSNPEVGDKNREKYPVGEQSYKDRDPNQFVDGVNYISDAAKDLDSQSSSYKSMAPQSQIVQWDDMQLKNLPIPRTTYRVVSVAGQPVGPDYPLPPSYAKAQQLEELMSRVWGKAYVQNLQQVNEYPKQDVNKNVVARMNNEQYSSQNDRRTDARFTQAVAKAGPAYVPNHNLIGRMNPGQTNVQEFQAAPTQLTNAKPFPVPIKPGLYHTGGNPGVDQAEANAYENVENPQAQASQVYDGSFTSQGGDKQQQTYENNSGQAYQSQPFVAVQKPREYNYPNNIFSPPQSFA